MKKNNMHYDHNQEQWLVELRGKEYPLYCGESFELYIGQQSIPCQLELSDNWYVIMDDTSFDLRVNSQYKINL